MRTIGALLLAAILTTGTPATAQDAVEQARAIVGAASTTPQTLVLTGIPRPTGPSRALLNGRDLSGWQAWLGYPDPAVTYKDAPAATPIGRTRPTTGDFAIRMIDGKPALWVKGETSGHTLSVREMRVDCDQDAVWIIAEPAGPACHTGARSCFYRRIVAEGLERVG